MGLARWLEIFENTTSQVTLGVAEQELQLETPSPYAGGIVRRRPGLRFRDAPPRGMSNLRRLHILCDIKGADGPPDVYGRATRSTSATSSPWPARRPSCALRDPGQKPTRIQLKQMNDFQAAKALKDLGDLAAQAHRELPQQADDFGDVELERSTISFIASCSTKWRPDLRQHQERHRSPCRLSSGPRTCRRAKSSAWPPRPRQG